MLLRPLTRPLASSCLSKPFNFLTIWISLVDMCNTASLVQCACWARLAIIMLGPSAKHSSSIASLASLPFDWAQSAQSPYSLLLFFHWTKLKALKVLIHFSFLPLDGSTRHIQGNCFNLQSTARSSESNAAPTLGIRSSLSLFLVLNEPIRTNLQTNDIWNWVKPVVTAENSSLPSLRPQ